MAKVGKKAKHAGRRKVGRKKRKALKCKNRRKNKTKRTGKLVRRKGGKKK